MLEISNFALEIFNTIRHEKIYYSSLAFPFCIG